MAPFKAAPHPLPPDDEGAFFLGSASSLSFFGLLVPLEDLLLVDFVLVSGSSCFGLAVCVFLITRTGVVFGSKVNKALSSPRAGSGLVGSLLVSLVVFKLELFSLDLLEASDFKDSLDFDTLRLDCFVGLNIFEAFGLLTSMDPSYSVDLLDTSDLDDFCLGVSYFSLSSSILEDRLFSPDLKASDFVDLGFGDDAAASYSSSAEPNVLEDLDNLFDSRSSTEPNVLQDFDTFFDSSSADEEPNVLEDLDNFFDSRSSTEPNVLEDLDTFFDSSSAEEEPNVLEDWLFPPLVLDSFLLDSAGFLGEVSTALEDRGWGYVFRDLNDVCFAPSRW
jgi:hypothetical protein